VHLKNDVLFEPIFEAVIAELVAIEATDSIVGGNPNVALLVLDDAIGFGTGQAVVGGVLAESGVRGGLGGERGKRVPDQCAPTAIERCPNRRFEQLRG